VNKIIVSGNLCKDIELKYTPDSLAIASFSIAVNEKYKDKESVSFFNVTAFGKTAENCEKYLGKGSKVLIDGSLKQESWEKDGEKKYAIKIIAQRVEFIGKPKEQAPQQEQAQAEVGVGQTGDLPF